jgi:hypothetical protein
MNENEPGEWAKKEIDRYLKEYGEVPPWWVNAPTSHPYSIHWRMGGGEGYRDVLYYWSRDHLTSQKDIIAYFLRYSPPPRYLGWVADWIFDLDLELIDEPSDTYLPFFKQMKTMGFKGTEGFAKDFNDPRWT